MNKNTWGMSILVVILMFAFIVSAVDFIPQGDINLKDVYIIKNWNISSCGEGELVAGIFSNGSWNCTATGAGSGDITGVLTPGDYLIGGCESGTCSIYQNETQLNATINDLNSGTNYSAGSNLSLIGTIFSVNMTAVESFFDSVYQSIGNYLTTATNYTHLSNFTDDIGATTNHTSIVYDLWNTLWNKVYIYTHLSNFTDDIGTYNETYDANILNKTFNQSLTDDLYAGIEWDYNQTELTTYNATYDLWAYNQTEIDAYSHLSNFTDDIDATTNHTSIIYDLWNTVWSKVYVYTHLSNFTDDIGTYNESYESTYNSTYDQWAYNQTEIDVYSHLSNFTDDIGTYNQTYESTYNATYDAKVTNETFNQSLTDDLYAGIEWDYNQTELTTYNETYDFWAYNQTEIDIYSHLSNFTDDIGTYNESYESTYNSTYDSWAYNQTEIDVYSHLSNFTDDIDATTNHTSIIYELWNAIWSKVYIYTHLSNFTDDIGTYNESYESTYNETYDLWAYNQTELTTYNETYDSWSYNQTEIDIYSHLSNFTDDIDATTNHTSIVYELWNTLWDKVYTHLSNFTNDIGNYNETYDLWAYNQTELSTYNSTYDYWSKDYYVNESGDTMTGNLMMDDNNVSGLDYLEFTNGGYIYDNGTTLILGHS